MTKFKWYSLHAEPPGFPFASTALPVSCMVISYSGNKTDWGVENKVQEKIFGPKKEEVTRG